MTQTDGRCWFWFGLALGLAVMMFSAYGDKKAISGTSPLPFQIACVFACRPADLGSGSGLVRSSLDPYYGGGAGFERAYQQCVRYSREFLDELEKDGVVGDGKTN